MNSSLSVLLKKFAVPTIFIVLGVAILVFGFNTNQDGTFKLSALFLLIGGVLSLMYSSGRVKSSIINILGGITAIVAIVILYLSFTSVATTQKYNENYAIMKLKAQQNLSDVRFIQKMHAAEKGKYAATWEEFIAFAKTATMDYVDAVGVVPARKMTSEESKYVYKDNRPIDKSMTEEEALILSKWANCPEDLKGFKRDTLKVNLLKTKFGSSSYLESRKIAGIGKFSLDSLPVIPLSTTKWKLEVRDSVASGAEKSPAIKVSGTLPLTEIQGSKKKEQMFFGSTSSNDTGGSWE